MAINYSVLNYTVNVLVEKTMKNMTVIINQHYKLF